MGLSEVQSAWNMSLEKAPGLYPGALVTWVRSLELGRDGAGLLTGEKLELHQGVVSWATLTWEALRQRPWFPARRPERSPGMRRELTGHRDQGRYRADSKLPRGPWLPMARMPFSSACSCHSACQGWRTGPAALPSAFPQQPPWP